MGKRSKADIKHAIDLLWSHQIRRENAALHKHVQGLRQEVLSLTEEVKNLRITSQQVAAVAERASASVFQAVADHASLRDVTETARYEAQDQFDKIEKIEASLAQAQRIHDQAVSQFTEDLVALRSGLAFLREQLERQMSQTRATVDQILVKVERRDKQQDLAALEERVRQVESAIQQESKMHSVSRVEDSFDPQAHCFNDRSDHDGQQDLPMPCQTSFTTVDETHEAKVMLTVKDSADDDQSTAAGDFDLDEHVDTMSFARNLMRDVPMTESLRTLPRNEPYRELLPEIKALNQERFHSWDRYFAEGHALVKQLPRKYESDVVRHFVEGLYAQNQREQCEMWLDVNGWNWEGVAGFGLSGTPSVPIHLGDVGSEKLRATHAKPERQLLGVQPDKEQDEVFKKPEKRQERISDNPRSEPKAVPLQSQRLTQQPLPSQTVDCLQAQQSGGEKAGSSKTKAAQTNFGSRTGWERLRDTKGRFQRLSCSNGSENEKRAGFEITKVSVETPSAVETTNPETLVPQVEPAGAELPRMSGKATRSVPTINATASLPSASNASVQVAEPPRTPQHQVKRARAQGAIVPRLVKRKNDTQVSGDQRRKRVHLIDDLGLPHVPKQPDEQDGRALDDQRRQKRRRLPLPPPPEIPIMPTSD